MPPRATHSSPLLPRAYPCGISPQWRFMGVAQCFYTEHHLFRPTKPQVWAGGGIEPPTSPLLGPRATRPCLMEMEFCAWPRGSRRVCLRLLGPGLCTQFASTIADSLSVPDLIFFAYCLPEAAFSGPQDMQFFICQLRAQAVRPKHDFWTSANRGTCSQLPIGVYYCLPARV